MEYQDINASTIDRWIEEGGNGENQSAMKYIQRHKKETGMLCLHPLKTFHIDGLEI
ncbi:MAG: hypothetical protein K6E70_01890 [Butyrivibrio sp.]|nr:hypothetical protein [Butyrivibrio sp.]